MAAPICAYDRRAALGAAAAARRPPASLPGACGPAPPACGSPAWPECAPRRKAPPPGGEPPAPAPGVRGKETPLSMLSSAVCGRPAAAPGLTERRCCSSRSGEAPSAAAAAAAARAGLAYAA